MDRFIDSLPFLTDSLTQKLHNVEWKYTFVCGLYTSLLIFVIYYFIGSTDGYFPPQRYHTFDVSRAEVLAREAIEELVKFEKIPRLFRKEKKEPQHSAVPVSAPEPEPVLERESTQVEEPIIPGEVPVGW